MQRSRAPSGDRATDKPSPWYWALAFAPNSDTGMGSELAERADTVGVRGASQTKPATRQITISADQNQTGDSVIVRQGLAQNAEDIVVFVVMFLRDSLAGDPES